MKWSGRYGPLDIGLPKKGIGAVTCLMRGPIGEIEAAPGGAAFALAILDEAVATVRVIGRGPSEACLTATRDRLTAKGSPLTSSMSRDLLQGRPVEVETIVGDLVRSAAGAGIDSPLLRAAYTHLSVFENRLENTLDEPSPPAVRQLYV